MAALKYKERLAWLSCPGPVSCKRSEKEKK